MSSFIVNCPGCAQPLQCDPAWAGQVIQCPACNKELVVPGQAAGKLPPSKQVGVGTAFAGAGKKKGGKRAMTPQKGLAIVLTVVICGVGGFFAFKGLMKLQSNMNAADERERNLSGGGGQVAGIAELNQFLDATDPNRFSRLPAPERSRPDPDELADRMGGLGGTRVVMPTNDLPLLPAVYTLDVATAKIPEGRVNGKLAGKDFAPDSVRLDAGTTSRPLRFRMGNPVSPELELMVFLKLKAGENPAGKTWSVAKNEKSRDISSVTKLWKYDPKYAPKRKDFFTGYALKLELAAQGEGVLKGKVYLALPDTEQSVIAGVFYAEAVDVVAPVAAPTAAPAGEGLAAPIPERYGKPR
jgi:hypothetical protein